MIPLHSTIENNIYPLFVLEERLKPSGEIMAANWDYTKEFIELAIEDQEAHYVLKIPFYAVKGSLNYPGITVRVDQPYLLEYTLKNDRAGEEATWTAEGGYTSSLTATDDMRELQMRGGYIMQKIEQLLLPS